MTPRNSTGPKNLGEQASQKQKLSLNFTERDVQRAKRLAVYYGMTVTEVLKRALAEAEVLHEPGREAETLITLRKDGGDPEQVVLPPW